jgi:glutamine synthetase
LNHQALINQLPNNPKETSQKSRMVKKLKKYLKKNAIQFVRILWCDNANIIRAKAFHTHFLTDHQTQGIGISAAQQAIPVMVDAVVPHSGLSPVGEAWLQPDWSTLNPLPYSPGHARVMGNLMYQGQPWEFCPRGFLRRMLAQAEDLGFQVKAAFENEFYLLEPNANSPVPADSTPFASTLAIDLNYAVINDIAAALIAQGIQVERYYAESGHGQHEFAIRYTDALAAADQQIAFRETVRGVALRHNLRASFLPKLFADQAGSGCHLHLSLWQSGHNILPSYETPGELSTTARSFVAGILHHLPALMALTTPSSNSYRRLQPHFWSGAYRCWGTDNREAALRVPSNPTLPSPTHLELRTIDASANPYIALGGTIAAGLDGIRQSLELGEPAATDPGHLSEEDRQRLGIDRLPQNLGEAIAHLSQNEILQKALGTELSQAYLAVRKAEWEALKDFSLEQEIKLLMDKY